MNRQPSAPLRDAARFPDLGLHVTLIPRQVDSRHFAARPVLVGGAHRGRGDLGMRRRAAGLHGERRFEFERPERQVVPVGAQVAHRAVAEIPPAIPFGARDVDRVKRPFGRGPEPQVPVQAGGDRLALAGPIGDIDNVMVASCVFPALQSPGTTYPNMRLAHGADGAGLHQLDHAAVVLGRMNLNAHLRGDFGCAAASRIWRASQML